MRQAVLPYRLLLCGDDIVYYHNVTAIEMPARSGQITIHTPNTILTLNRNDFPTNAQKDHKIAINQEQEFRKVSDKIIKRVKATNPTFMVDGDVYSCVQGQGIAEFHYGNIFTAPFSEILATGANKINLMHQKQGLDTSCQACSHLSLCNTGCPVVKVQQDQAKSYTCQLQKHWYAHNPLTFKPLDESKRPYYLSYYKKTVHPNLALVKQNSQTKATLGFESKSTPTSLIQGLLLGSIVYSVVRVTCKTMIGSPMPVGRVREVDFQTIITTITTIITTITTIIMAK